MAEYKTVLDRATGELKKVRIGETLQQSPAKAPPSIDITNKDALRTMALNTLVEVIQANPKSLAVIPAIRELLDRIDGKPGQAVTLDANINQVTVNASISFVRAQPVVDNSIITIEGKAQ